MNSTMPTAMPSAAVSLARTIGIAGWAAFGVATMLAESVVRLTLHAVPVLRAGLSPAEWAAFAGIATTLVYVEGYRGFARSFCPRVVERAFALAAAPKAAHVLVAPLHAMSLVLDTRARMARAWALVAMIVLFVVGVRQLPPVWRAMIDASVALAMAWGLADLVRRFAARAKRAPVA